MIKHIVIREFGYLAMQGETNGLDRAVITPQAWHWLRQYALTRPHGQAELFRPAYRQQQEYLQVKNYIGVIETPCGTHIEILPKTTSDHQQSLLETRAILYKMLSRIFKLPNLQVTSAHLQTFQQPLLEILITQFLYAVNHMLRQGIRHDYQPIFAQTPFLRGKLQVHQQARQIACRQHLFNSAFNAYITNRAENRLLHHALRLTAKWAMHADNQRLISEILPAFTDIPLSTDIAGDLQHWQQQRDMSHYQPLQAWCQLILHQQTPLALSGHWPGISLLFPMEKLFEKYVGLSLQQQLPKPYQLQQQLRQYFLAQHKQRDWWALCPDLVIQKAGRNLFVLDTKWKLINAQLNSKRDQYQLQQHDLYQLFAYGHKYLQGKGDVYLIYPAQPFFQQALAPFHFTENLRLWVIPFDLKTEQFIDINFA